MPLRLISNALSSTASSTSIALLSSKMMLLVGAVGVKNIYSAKCLCCVIQQRCGGLVLGGVERGAYGLTTQAGDLLYNRCDPVCLPGGAATTTNAPSEANLNAVTAPLPRLAPATTATLFARRLQITSCCVLILLVVVGRGSSLSEQEAWRISTLRSR